MGEKIEQNKKLKIEVCCQSCGGTLKECEVELHPFPSAGLVVYVDVKSHIEVKCRKET